MRPVDSIFVPKENFCVCIANIVKVCLRHGQLSLADHCPMEYKSTMANASLQVAEIDQRTIGEGLLEAAIRQAPCFIGICDDQWRPVFINSAGRRMVGLGEDADVSALAIDDFFEERDRQVIRDVTIPMLMRTGSWEGSTVSCTSAAVRAHWSTGAHFCCGTRPGAMSAPPRSPPT